MKGEFATVIDTLSQERSNLLNDLADLRLNLAELKSEKEAKEKEQKAEREREVEMIHERVKCAIAKKEEMIAELKKSNEQCLDQIEHLEASLDRQTKMKVLSKTSIK